MNDYCGSIALVLGPMFSGKTSELIRLVERQKYAQKSCILIRYAQDDRYSTECVATHHGQQMSAISAAVLAEVHSECCDYDVIGIDEGQFFPDIVEFSEEMANRGKMVVIAALDGTFERLPFPNRVLDLIAQAEHVVKLQAVCSECGASAPFSKRISAETNVQLIGGADKYVAVCRRCYHNGPPKTRDVPEHSPIALKASNAPRAW